MKKYLQDLINAKETRSNEIKASIKTAETAEEVRSLGNQLEEIQGEIRAAKDQLAALEEAEKKPEQRDFNPMAAFGVDNKANEEAEKRAKEFADKGKMNIPAKEARSILLATGGIAKPTEVGGINDFMNVVSSIVDQVYIEDCTGMGQYNEAYMVSPQSAGMGTDGTAPEGSDPSFRNAAIKPFLVNVVTYVSRELKKQTPLQYESKVKDSALIALRKKVAALIVNGNGSTEPYGIKSAVNTESIPEVIYETLSLDSTTIGADTLRKIVMSYGGDENVGANAVLYLNKTDLIAFGDVRGTSEKKAVYEIIPDGSNPNTGIIKDGGLAVPYCINSALTALSSSTRGASAIKTMVYGDPLNYKLGLFGDFEVNVSEDYKFAEGLLTVRGEVMVGGNLTVDNGMVVVTLAAN